MSEGFAGTIERRELSPMGARFVEVAGMATDILESIARRVESTDDHPQPLLAEGGETREAVDARLVPLLDLSPGELDSEKIAEYFKANGIEFSSQTLFVNGFDGERLEMHVGPAFASADFYFSTDGKNLTVVFATADGSFTSLRLTDGVFDGYNVSDKAGQPVPFQSLA